MSAAFLAQNSASRNTAIEFGVEGGVERAAELSWGNARSCHYDRRHMASG